MFANSARDRNRTRYPPRVSRLVNQIRGNPSVTKGLAREYYLLESLYNRSSLFRPGNVRLTVLLNHTLYETLHNLEDVFYDSTRDIHIHLVYRSSKVLFRIG